MTSPLRRVPRGNRGWFCPKCNEQVRAIEIEEFQPVDAGVLGAILGIVGFGIVAIGICPECRSQCLTVELGGNPNE